MFIRTTTTFSTNHTNGIRLIDMALTTVITIIIIVIIITVNSISVVSVQTLPQPRQWWRRNAILNSSWQSMHIDTRWSGIQTGARTPTLNSFKFISICVHRQHLHQSVCLTTTAAISHNTSRWRALGKAVLWTWSQATVTPKVDHGPHSLI